MISLSLGQVYMTENGQDAFKVMEGSLDVFVVPFESGIQGRPEFILRAEEGMTIPALSYTDPDHVKWLFRFEPKDRCQLQPVQMGATRPLKKRFLKMIDMADGESGASLEESLRERYMSDLVQDDVLITRSEIQREKEKKEAREIVERGASMEAAFENTGAEPLERAGTDRRIDPTRPQISLPKDHLPQLILFAAAMVGVAFGMIISLREAVHPAITIVLAWVYILLLWLAGRRCRLWAEKKALAGQKVMIDRIYGPAGGSEDEDGQMLALGMLRNYQITRRRSVREYQGTMALAISAGVIAVTFFIFPISAAVSLGTLVLSGALLLSAAGRADHHKRRADLSGSKGNAGLLDALTRIEKVRLSGAVEHTIRRYYVRKREEKLRERAGSRMLVIGRVGTSLVASAALLITVCLLLFGGTNDHQSISSCILGFGIAIGEGIYGILCLAGTGEGERNPVARGEEKSAEVASREPATGKALGEAAAGEVILELDGVCFAYDERDILRDISLKIGKGEHLAIVGASGSGKSTLMKLISGVKRPCSGKIRFMGREMGDLEVETLKGLSGRVAQNDQLLTASIMENLLLADEATDHRSIRRALEDADLLEDIRSMPMGADTMIREDGENISAGQKQKLLIARALVSDPAILFFDEAESELSEEEQSRISGAIASRGATVITISHQYQTISKCDKIIVIDRGNIVEMGSPEQLLEEKGKFYSLMYRQV